MQIKNTTIKYLFLGSLFLAFFVASFSVLAVWDEPNSDTPNNDPYKSIQGPLNISGSNQQKVGPIILQTGFRSTGPIIFDDNPKFLLSGYAQNKVLTSDAEGNASWKDLQGGQSSVPWGEIGGNLQDQEDLETELVNLNSAIVLKALTNAPTLTGDPQAPTPNANDNDTSIATTEFVNRALDGLSILSNGWNRTSGLISLIHSGDNILVGQNTVFYKGDTNDPQNRFIHDIGTRNFSLGLNSGSLTASGTQSGADNTAFGKNVLSNIINSGCCGRNTAFGHEALSLNTRGSDNTAFGYQALNKNNSVSDVYSSKNTAFGYQALYNNTTGGSNTGFGYRALYNNTTGERNTAFGYQTLWFNQTASNNTAVGALSGIGSNSFSNTTAIGYNVLVTRSDTMVFGNNTIVGWGFGTNSFVSGGTNYAMRVGTSTANGNGAGLTTSGVWTNASDLNKKTNIQNLNYGLKEVLQLRPVSFNWKDSNKHDIGFIAQEVKQIIPELVYGQEGDLSLAYSQLPVVLVNAVNEQQKEIEKYRQELEALQIRLKALQD